MQLTQNHVCFAAQELRFRLIGDGGRRQLTFGEVGDFHRGGRVSNSDAFGRVCGRTINPLERSRKRLAVDDYAIKASAISCPNVHPPNDTCSSDGGFGERRDVSD